MKKRDTIYYLFLVFSFLFFPSFAFADAHLRINEIMYNPEGSDTRHEWVEVYNDGDQNIDISQWYFWEGNTFHKLYPENDFSIVRPGDFFLIVQDLDWARSAFGNFHYVKASFSLNNTGEILRISDDQKRTVDEVSYRSEIGGNGNAKSLQYFSGTFSEADPTPGKVNKKTEENLSEENSFSDEEESENEEKSESFLKKENYSLQIEIPSSVFEKEDFYLRVSLKKSKEQILNGFFVYNFGDGNALFEREWKRDHIYRYQQEGIYHFVFAYYSSSLLFQEREDPDVFFEKDIYVFPSSQILLKEANPSEGVILVNESAQKISLSGWKLEWNGKTFSFPPYSYLLPKRKIHVLPETLQFSPVPTFEKKIFLKTNANFPIDSLPKKDKRIKKVILKKKIRKTKGKRSKEVFEKHESDKKEKLVLLSEREVPFSSLTTLDKKEDDFRFSQFSFNDDNYLKSHPGKVLIQFENEQNSLQKKPNEGDGIEAIYYISFFLLIFSLILLKKQSKINKKDEEIHIELIE